MKRMRLGGSHRVGPAEVLAHACRFIVAVDDPKTFWDAAQVALAELPERTTLQSTIPNEGGSRATCLREPGSVDTLRGIVEGAVGHVSKNESSTSTRRTRSGSRLGRGRRQLDRNATEPLKLVRRRRISFKA
jgi:hypothetical protein